ncbi:DUF4932 domain-containing protein [Oceanirhabdus seepicola]|uniref:DUF4932 domain-containing protein n=1 Tax=Oceanirhabdus seepicola TaxID=2828781 RepID=A0A9J6NZS4_9CLOT|nr:DUF4932 domain-containing protein [Oceanirhabdus seepicola]MCM1989462.1 DUF4932 domain-containing protein [Oceanirhabdus seepicola]
MKKYSIMIIMCLLLISCSSSNGSASTAKKNTNKSELVLYEHEGDINYKIYNNKMVDTYIIASALYLDFKSDRLLPDTDRYPLYIKAKEYFTPYRDHPFIQEFSEYLWYDDINSDVITILLNLSNDYKLENNIEVDQVSYTFSNKEEIEKFIKDFKKFYEDTKAEEFLNSNSEIYLSMKEYYNNNRDKADISILLKEMESYIGVNEKITKTINYQTVVTPWRPFMGSFFQTDTEDKVTLYSFQSLLNYNSRNLEDYDIEQSVSTEVHEFLHFFVNKPVKDNNFIIDKFNQFSNKEELVESSLYSSMPWNRITDEYFVRAIQGRIYRNVYDEKKARHTILDKELLYGGFHYLNGIYEKLEEYENNREKYKSIDSFVPILIEELFSNGK